MQNLWITTIIMQQRQRRQRQRQKSKSFGACFHGGRGPQVGEVSGGSPHQACKRDQIKMRDYMDGRVTPPKRVTSPTWGPPPPCKQAVRLAKQ